MRFEASRSHPRVCVSAIAHSGPSTARRNNGDGDVLEGAATTCSTIVVRLYSRARALGGLAEARSIHTLSANMIDYADLMVRAERAKELLLECSVALARAARWSVRGMYELPIAPGHWFARKAVGALLSRLRAKLAS